MAVIMKSLVLVISLWLHSTTAQDAACLVDVVFCIDNSASIGGAQSTGGGQNWKNILDYTQSLVKLLNVGPLTTHVALVDFGWYGYLNFDLNKYTTEAEVVTAIGNLAYRAEYTNTFLGMQVSHQVLMDEAQGSRPGVNKLLILVTDGDPSHDKEKLQPEVDSIKGDRIRIVTVAVGDLLNEDSMRAIASTPRDYVHASDFSSLQTIKASTINEETCNKPPPTTTTAAPPTTAPVTTARMTEPNPPVTTAPPATTTAQAPTTTRDPKIFGTPGAVYTRWGSSSCPDGRKVVYTGVSAGSWYGHAGSGHEYLCLPEVPEWGKTIIGDQGWTGYVYGTEYELIGPYNKDKSPFSFENYAGAPLHDNDAPCTVCVNPNAHTTIMIPAAKNCLKEDWNLEYTGYLASPDKTQFGREYVCVDGAPDVLMRGEANADGALFRPVEARCGSLPCPAYVEGWELTCTVCSK